MCCTSPCGGLGLWEYAAHYVVWDYANLSLTLSYRIHNTHTGMFPCKTHTFNYSQCSVGSLLLDLGFAPPPPGYYQNHACPSGWGHHLARCTRTNNGARHGHVHVLDIQLTHPSATQAAEAIYVSTCNGHVPPSVDRRRSEEFSTAAALFRTTCLARMAHSHQHTCLPAQQPPQYSLHGGGGGKGGSCCCCCA